MNEFGVRYALDLTMNQDASIYLDTRNLRGWLLSNSRGKRVLNTFAYTGSLGAAALAGGAVQVVQLDLNARFMLLARRTYALNGFQSRDQDFLTGDFFARSRSSSVRVRYSTALSWIRRTSQSPKPGGLIWRLRIRG